MKYAHAYNGEDPEKTSLSGVNATRIAVDVPIRVRPREFLMQMECGLITMESGTPNTLCPYLTQPLTSGFPVDEEHVLPFALGAPSTFTVTAAKAENARLNLLVDAPMINDPLVENLSMLAGVKTRSGRKTATMHGSTASGDEFLAEVTKESVSPRFRSPVIKDDKSGEVIGVRGFGNGVFDEARKLAKRMAAKGRAFPEGGPAIMVEDSSDLPMSFTSDLLLLRREAIKTAYLLTVKAFGDCAIRSENGRIFRAAIEAHTDDELQASGLRREWLSPERIPLKVPLKVKHHFLITQLEDDALFSSVTLFGRITLAFRTPRDDIDLEICRYAKLIDASTHRFVNHPDE